MLVRASVAAAIVSMLPRPAGACSPDLCEGVDAGLDLAPLHAAAVPTDGVLVLTAEVQGELDTPTLAARASLTVTRDGAEVAGALEPGPYAGVLLWRPAEALVAGAAYQVDGSFTNPGEPDGGCGEGVVPFGFTFAAADGPTAAISPPKLGAMVDYLDDPVVSLETLVCCNDAYPVDTVMCGVSYGLTWSEGLCTSLETRGYLRLRLTGTPTADPASASQWAFRLRQDGEVVAAGVSPTFNREIEAPSCFAVDQVSLATGELAEGDALCFGEDDVDRLGTRPLDPLLAVGGKCVSDLYTCEIVDGEWRRDNCMSWGVDEAPDDVPPPASPNDAGCGCRGAPRDATGLLALLGLVRRRRVTTACR